MLAFSGTLPRVSLLGQPTAEPWRRPFLHLQARHRRYGPMLTRKSVCGWESETSHERAVDGTSEHTDEPSDMTAAIRASLRSMGEGEISISAYDTAMVALVKNLDGGDGPHFPSTINWIVQNQLPDGSWGDEAFFMATDRIINTLACVVALASWNIYADKCETGLLFIRENMWRLAKEEEDWMLVGFEIAFPSLLEMAKNLNLDISYDDPAFQAINAKRNIKLTKIPRDVLHARPTTLLHSIEGMVDLDWEMLLKLRCLDGSFHCSPAATASALQRTGDQKCLEFLDGIIKKFNGGVPCIYPLDVYERLWAVDRLTRLGIHRHFTSEVEECLDYVYRHWTEEGLAHTKNCPVKDIDDTAMGFRLLRLHGYDVNPCVFKNFEKDGEFICLQGESIKSSITPMYNAYRAAQIAFPSDDNVLGRAEVYCRAFLQERRTSNKLKDKWAIAKDIPGEVKYAMDFPWKGSLPRIETRMYLEQYGGSSDIWIGKVLHRMTLFCNELYLKVAKSDFNNFQRLARLEWHGLKKWYLGNHLQRYGGTPKSALIAYFLASANIFETERKEERLGWARMAVVAEAVTSHFRQHGGPKDSTTNLEELIDLVALDDASGSLHEAWKQWLMACIAKGNHGLIEGDTALLLVRTIEICSGRHVPIEQKLNLWEYSQLEQLTSSICRNLATRVLTQNGKSIKNPEDIDQQVDLEMQELSWRIHQGCHGINRDTKQTFLHVVKSFYYAAHCSPEIIDSHIDKVIFQDVI
uniref:Uncharacterized protein n=1 Tax=Avena sativa TaxID=4498 RepID=A0ACD5WDW3_AVESA